LHLLRQCCFYGAGRISLARFAIAHPSLLREPFVLGPADGAENPGEEYRCRPEPRAVRYEAGFDVVSGSRTSHHDSTHWLLLFFSRMKAALN
jgi:hypothetical protein